MGETKNIWQRINAIMRDVRGVGKHQRNPQGNYNYAGHEAVTEALHDAYVKHGVVRTATVIKSDVLDRGVVSLMVRVSWVAIEGDSRLDVEIPAVAPSVRKDGGVSAVQVGAALSYAVKNAEFKTFALTGDDSPDAEEQDDRDHEDTSDFANDAGQEYLKKLDTCANAAEVQAVSDDVKKKWSSLKTIPGFGERFVEARGKAFARVAKKAEREPGED